MTLCIRRETLSGAAQAFTFDKNRSDYLVKNLSDADMYVAFEADAQASRSIKIPSMYAQVCSCFNVEGTTGMTTATVYVTGTGEVEVQQL